jgi:glutamate--cysteine ligase
MSSHEGSGNITLITGVAQLIEHHARGEKPRERWSVGTEHEKFGFSATDLRPLGYRGQGGRAGIREVLLSMTQRGWVPLEDNGELIALTSQDGSIALEPGGQFELSGAVRKTLHETRDELSRHVDELALLERELGVKWLWIGAQPVATPDDLDFMPKRRYAIMRDYLPTRGALALHMMKTTSTVQANLDYASEQDMGEKLKTAMGVSSIVAAIFGNSPFQNGKPCGLKSFRSSVWSATDPDRQGLLPFAFESAPSYEQYVRWALDVPMFFIVRNGDYLPARGQTFRHFQERGFIGNPSYRATMEDWELHLSTLFPDVRMKTYLETRTADCVPPRYIMALPALWKGLLYSSGARLAAWDLVKRWSLDARSEHRTLVPRFGLETPVPGSRATTAELARELFDIAAHGLAEQARDFGYADESLYLEPLRALVASGKSPADELLALWKPEMTAQQLVKRLIEAQYEG